MDKRKLLRSETNSQILRNLHFCNPFTPIFDKHIETRFPLKLYYSQSQKGSTSHVMYCFDGAKPFPGLRPRQGRQNSICSSLTLLFRKFLSFFGIMPNPFCKRDFSKTHSWTCHLHSWIALGLTIREKLVRSETNSQILRNLHFCEPFTPIFDKHVETRLAARGKPSTIVYRAGDSQSLPLFQTTSAFQKKYAPHTQP